MELMFGDNVLNFSENHRHLGVTFSNNAKWGDHIETICQSAMKKVNALRKLKFLVKRNVLSKIYLCFILPVMEYACNLGWVFQILRRFA